jgi:tetratricopeptide (TPR) repeat protein
MATNNDILDIPASEQDSLQKSFVSAESFFERNKKPFIFGLLAIMAVVIAVYAYKNFIVAPKEKKADEQIFMAQNYFEKDSLNQALNGDAQNPGFLKIISKFSGTNAANLSHYYAGICYLKQGDFKNAIKYLEDFNGAGTQVGAVAKGALGDAYCENGNFDKGVSSYKDAAAAADDDFLAPLYTYRAAAAAEKNGKTEEALAQYKKLKEKYSKSQQGREADKYITRLEGLK